jgi:hypothetical protein
MAMPMRLHMEPSYGVKPDLYVPQARKKRVYVPDELSILKVVYFKGRPFGTDRWFGGRVRMPYNVDLDDMGQDGISVRDQIHLQLTGLIERAGYRWVYQGSDERQGTTVIEEHAIFEDNEAHWNRFVRRDS